MEASDYLYGAGARDNFSSDKRISEQKPGDHFVIDDLLNLSNDDAIMGDGFFDNSSNNVVGNSSSNSSLLTSIDSCNSPISGGDNKFSGFAGSQFSGELCVPYDDLAELEWLSNFVDDSFSAERDMETKCHYLPGPKPPASESSSSDTFPEPTRNSANAIFQPDTPLVPGKARSKRSRAAPCDWTTRLLHVSPTTKPAPAKKQENPNSNSEAGPVRKCLHCSSEKTPQWRTGPMGPKTLCNACGVRYKSGRLVPEYRPASSPTFVSTKHSNSHRKVVELRRQKDLQRAQHQQFLGQSSMFGISNGADDYLIRHHSGPHFRQMI